MDEKTECGDNHSPCGEKTFKKLRALCVHDFYNVLFFVHLLQRVHISSCLLQAARTEKNREDFLVFLGFFV